MPPDALCPVCHKAPCIHDAFASLDTPPPGPGEHGQYSALYPEPITVIEAWELPHHLACVLKYLARHPRKGGLEDLRKAAWYLDRYIELLEERGGDQP